MRYITSILKESENIQRLVKLAKTGTEALVNGVSDAQKRHLAYTISDISQMKGLYIAWNEMQARQAYADFSYLTNDKTIYLSNKEIMLYDVDARSFEQTYGRVASLVKILEDDYQIIVTSCEALMHFLMPPDSFQKHIIVLEQGMNIESGDIEQKLLEIGYERVERVESRGQYAKRGGILDIYPVNTESP